VKPLSAVKNGQPGTPLPVAVLKAYSSIPSEGATTDWAPCRLPTASEAWTPSGPCGSVADLDQKGTPVLVMAV